MNRLLKKQREKLNLSVEEIAAYTRTSIPTVYRWLSGETKKIPKNKIESLAKILDIPESSLEPEKQHLVKPILGRVRAGYNLFVQETLMGYEEVAEAEALQGDYYLEVDGDSMNGSRIFDGDLVYVRQVEDVESGKIAVVLVGEEVTIKKVIKKESLLILEASNPNYETRYFTPEEVDMLPVKIIGQVIHVKIRF